LFDPVVRCRHRRRHRQPAGRHRGRIRHGRARAVWRLRARRRIPAGADRAAAADGARHPSAADASLPAGRAMNSATLQPLAIWLMLAAGIAAPLLFPDYSTQFAVLWLMIVFSLTWDILGGQMGYNSLGNIFFFGAGMYVCAIVQIGLF